MLPMYIWGRGSPVTCQWDGSGSQVVGPVAGSGGGRCFTPGGPSEVLRRGLCGGQARLCPLRLTEGVGFSAVAGVFQEPAEGLTGGTAPGPSSEERGSQMLDTPVCWRCGLVMSVGFRRAWPRGSSYLRPVCVAAVCSSLQGQRAKAASVLEPLRNQGTCLQCVLSGQRGEAQSVTPPGADGRQENTSPLVSRVVLENDLRYKAIN